MRAVRGLSSEFMDSRLDERAYLVRRLLAPRRLGRIRCAKLRALDACSQSAHKRNTWFWSAAIVVATRADRVRLQPRREKAPLVARRAGLAGKVDDGAQMVCDA